MLSHRLMIVKKNRLTGSETLAIRQPMVVAQWRTVAFGLRDKHQQKQGSVQIPAQNGTEWDIPMQNLESRAGRCNNEVLVRRDFGAGGGVCFRSGVLANFSRALTVEREQPKR
jgi:hypothetical protein